MPNPSSENPCAKCTGTGSIPSGVCHCGESMDTPGVYAHDNHSPVEMDGPCDICYGLGTVLTLPLRLAEGELGYLINLSTRDRYTQVRWGIGWAELIDCPANQWTLQALAVLFRGQREAFNA